MPAEYIRIGADALQVISLVKAAKGQRKAQTSCFVAGTEVLTGSADRLGVFSEKNIEDVRLGDLVWSKSEGDPDAALELRPVTRLFQRMAYDLQSVSILDENGNVEVVHTTDEHPFYAQGRGWIEAASLRVGDHLLSADGGELTVIANADETHSQGVPVYNFEVDGTHTYFVEDGRGAASYTWVHNKCSINQMNKDIKTKNAPHTVERVDKGRGPFEQDHVHFKDGAALNKDGTWKHGSHSLSNDESAWLDKHEWWTG